MTQKIVTNAGWDIPLKIGARTDYPDSTYPNALKDTTTHTHTISVTVHFADQNYVKMIEINEPGERVFNIIYFTLQPGEGWPKKVRKPPSLNHPEGIL